MQASALLVSHATSGSETALAVEAAVRSSGAVPAVVAVVAGVPRVGLTVAELEALARAGPSSVKTSRRDLPFVCARAATGATTVSATMLLAHRAGIHVFVTGGIGGVHRGAQDSMDVSADVIELGRTPVAVVCAGVKSLLDIPRTLEVLETQGVAVCAFGQDAFPAFYTRDSGVRAPHRVDSADEAAACIAASLRLGLQGGLLIAVPVPAAAAADAEEVEAATQAALAQAAAEGVTGAAQTPFLLARIAEATGGSSLRANVALVTHNARVGGAIAVALARRLRGAVCEP